MKMTTTASGRIAGSKRQIGKALCTTTGRKSNGSEKKYHVIRKTAHATQKNQGYHCCLYCINCIFSIIHHLMQRVVIKRERKCKKINAL